MTFKCPDKYRVKLSGYPAGDEHNGGFIGEGHATLFEQGNLIRHGKGWLAVSHVTPGRGTEMQRTKKKPARVRIVERRGGRC